MNKVVLCTLLLVCCLSVSIVKASSGQDNELCADRGLPWVTPCYAVTSVNDFPPSIRMEGHQDSIPSIARTYIEVSPKAGEALLSSSKYISEFIFGPNLVSTCPNGGIESVGVLGNYGLHGNPNTDPFYPSGVGIVKIECY